MNHLYCPSCRETKAVDDDHYACDVCGGQHETYYRTCPTPTSNWRTERPAQSAYVCIYCGHEDLEAAEVCPGRESGRHSWSGIVVGTTYSKLVTA